MTTPNKRRLLAVGAVVAVIVIIVGIALLTGGKKEDKGGITTLDNGTKYDPSSGETYSDPKGKTPENYGEVKGAPLYLGTSSLLDYGVSSTQLDDLKYGIFQYFQTNNLKVAQVSVVVDTVAPVDRDPESDITYDTINFNIMVDNKTTYKVKVNYFDLDSAQVYISNLSGTQLYDSGVITNKQL